MRSKALNLTFDNYSQPPKPATMST